MGTRRGSEWADFFFWGKKTSTKRKAARHWLAAPVQDLGKRKGSEWTPIYMLIVMVIAAILIFTLVKPILRQASDTASSNLDQARAAAKSAIFLLTR